MWYLLHKSDFIWMPALHVFDLLSPIGHNTIINGRLDGTAILLFFPLMLYKLQQKKKKCSNNDILLGLTCLDEAL